MPFLHSLHFVFPTQSYQLQVIDVFVAYRWPSVVGDEGWFVDNEGNSFHLFGDVDSIGDECGWIA